jgi:hypothetical protein
MRLLERLNARQIALRQTEGELYRLDLRDDDQGRRAARVDQIAGLYQQRTRLAVDG